MPVAAVPAYLARHLENDFSTASPAQRFGIFLPVWTERRDQEAAVKQRASTRSREGSDIAHLLRQQGMEATIQHMQRLQRNPLAGLWEKNDFAAKEAWEKITALTNADKERMQALAMRQASLAEISAHTLTLDAIATAPFTTGLGNEHPLENGFAFLNPYGLPYLPGSGIKGVLRQAARELASGEWGDMHGWTTDTSYPVEINSGKTIALSVIDALFGLESSDGSTDHVRGALSFWDAVPQIPGDSLSVDIMTPHQSHYYQQKKDRKTGDSITPHDSGQPNPISFLTVPPGTRFAFHVQCDLAHLQRVAPGLAEDDHWKTLLAAAFEHAFAWLGFGAKTAVGYGAMQVDTQAAQRRQQERERAEAAERQRLEAQAEAARLASLSPAMQAIEAFIAEFRDKHTQYPGFKDRPNAVFHGKARALAKSAHESADWTAEEKRAAAEAIETWLPKLVQIDIKDERKKLKLNALKGL